MYLHVSDLAMGQVSEAPAGLSLAALLGQGGHDTHDDSDDDGPPPRPSLHSSPGRPSSAAPPSAQPQQKDLKGKSSGSGWALRLKGSAAMSKADTTLKNLFGGPGKRQGQAAAPTLGPQTTTLPQRASGSMPQVSACAGGVVLGCRMLYARPGQHATGISTSVPV